MKNVYKWNLIWLKTLEQTNLWIICDRNKDDSLWMCVASLTEILAQRDSLLPYSVLLVFIFCQCNIKEWWLRQILVQQDCPEERRGEFWKKIFMFKWGKNHVTILMTGKCSNRKQKRTVNFRKIFSQKVFWRVLLLKDKVASAVPVFELATTVKETFAAEQNQSSW